MSISVETRRELVTAVRDRYLATPSKRSRILDEFVKVTGYHRKHAIRVLRTTKAIAIVQPRELPSRTVYDEAFRKALVVLWEASDRICGKRLKALIPVLLPSLEKHGHVKLEQTVRDRILAISPSTIDRVLASRCELAGGRRRKPRARRASHSIPVRTFGDWKEPEVGFLADRSRLTRRRNRRRQLHTRSSPPGDASGWTECVALLVRESSLAVDGLERLRTSMTFAMRGIDSHNGSEFINETLLAYCQSKNIAFTRSRPYRKMIKRGSSRRMVL